MISQPGESAWFEEQPDRLQWEIDGLRAKGWSFTLDQEALLRGQMVLNDQVETEGGKRRLQIVFPDTYPEHRVEIYDLTGDGVLPLHENPYQHNLCLLDNLPEAWAPSDSAAMMVERVLELRAAAEDGVEGLERIGVGAPEPHSVYYPYIENSAVLIHESLLGIDADWGSFALTTFDRTNPLRAIVAKMAPSSASPQGSREAPGELCGLLGGLMIRGAWFRSPEPPPWLTTADEFRRWGENNLPDFERRLSREAKICSEFPQFGQVRAFAIVYPDDGPDGKHDAWLVCLLVKHPKRGHGGALLRPFILSGRDQERRISSLVKLRGKKVAVFGVGTVGAPIAMEFARTGLLAEMLLVDYDFFSVWNLVRHPLGLLELGLDKTAAVASRLRQSHPMLAVRILKMRVGNAVRADSSQVNQVAQLTQCLGGYDLIVDATADNGTTLLLNKLSIRLGVPLLVASVTEGGWGGEIVRSIPGQTGCYECYLWHGREEAMPVPEQDTDGAPVFTRGCGTPAFSGTGFDAMALAADAVRLGVQTMLRGEEGAYPDAPFDVVVRNNRASASISAKLGYQTTPLAVHPKCYLHGAR